MADLLWKSKGGACVSNLASEKREKYIFEIERDSNSNIGHHSLKSGGGKVLLMLRKISFETKTCFTVERNTEENLPFFLEGHFLTYFEGRYLHDVILASVV